jgi:hypothetical protein
MIVMKRLIDHLLQIAWNKESWSSKYFPSSKDFFGATKVDIDEREKVMYTAWDKAEIELWRDSI